MSKGTKFSCLEIGVVWPDTEALDSVAVLLHSISFSLCSNEGRRAVGQLCPAQFASWLCLGGRSIFQGLNKSPAALLASRISPGPGPH